MGSMRALLGALLGGVIGAAAWAGVAHFTGYEVGYLAWAIGGLVGFLTWIASGNQARVENGIMAAVVAAASVAGAKYFLADKYATEFYEVLAISYDADEAGLEREAGGEALPWPPGVEPDQRLLEEHYPDFVWADGVARFRALTSEEVDARMATVEAELVGPKSDLVMETFKDGFGALDLLFFGLAIFTAFKVGSGAMGGDESEAA